ncbi:VOC family protein [Paeniglutamicibacter sp.]|uniref:VOC family protein n=1 Tax=Paeniglutamicibacter sp. TaxID=1934391 RepID=UPI0039895035
MTTPRSGRLHHVEIWVRDLTASRASLGWLFQELGYTPGESWPHGTSYIGSHDYIVLESGPDVLDLQHRRCGPGLNHLAFVAGSRARVDELTAEAVARGFILLFTDVHPHAGGQAHYAAYLEDLAGFEIELVADDAAAG